MVHGCVIGNDAVVPPVTRLFNVVRSQEEGESKLRISIRGKGKGKTAPSGTHQGPPDRGRHGLLPEVSTERLRLI
jgi:hypothetical protein